MVSIDVANLAKLVIEQLEDRCVMTTLPWPLAAADNLGLMTAYGQFEDRSTAPGPGHKIHFHEGIDILTGAGAKVYAIEGGTVAKVRIPADPYFGRVSIATAADRGWNYLHITPTVVEGATVNQGDLIGTVVAAPAPLPTHLHLDASTGGFDPSYTTTLRPVADPLARLTPLGDTIPPTLGDIHFMRASDDNHLLYGGQWTGGYYIELQEGNRSHPGGLGLTGTVVPDHPRA
jgi:hypothetical protein